LAYLAGVFALLQGIDLVATHFAWPPATMRLVMIAAAAGLPIALVLAWFHGERGEQHVTGFELAILIVLMVIGGVALRWSAGARTETRVPTAMQERPVVAVLPLQNLGADEAFAAGLHDELIARLSLVQGIGVVSRTSTLAHRNAGLDAREIGAALGASHLLEGTVQRDGARVRLRLQFIDARSDQHLFARAFQRELTDVFEIQAVVASEIAESMRVALTAGERAGLERRPTAVAEAYEAYLAAREALRLGELQAAAVRLETALAADPGFIDAHALMTDAACQIAIHPPLLAPWVRDWRTVARGHATALERLAPQHPMTDLASGMVAYWIDEDLARGLAHLERASGAMPNEASAVHALYWVHARLGHREQADRLLERLDELEPGSEMSAGSRAWHALWRREYALAISCIDAMPETARNSLTWRWRRAVWETAVSRDLAPLRRFIAETEGLPKQAEARLLLARYSGDDATAYAIVAAAPEFASLSRFNLRGPRDMYLAGGVSPERRKPLLDSASAVLDGMARSTPDDPGLAVYRGWVAALGGDAPAALAHLERAEALMQREVDHLRKAQIASELAQAYALAGAADAAQRWLAVCLQAEGGCHAIDVRLDVLWRPVRADPRTEQLLRRLEDGRNEPTAAAPPRT
jgi:TolB-like protein